MAVIQVNVKAADGFGELATQGKYCPQNVLVDVEQDTATEDGLITGELTELHNDRVKAIKNWAFYDYNIQTAELPFVEKIGEYAFCKNKRLTSVMFPVAKSVLSNSFGTCGSLCKADLPTLSSIGSTTFVNCTSLTKLVLRKQDEPCTLSSTIAFEGTPIANGLGYIYVPAALLENYKRATNWSAFASQFRAIEDYPDIVSEPANLMANWDFESGTAGEAPTVGLGATFANGAAISDETAYRGSQSLKLVRESTGAGSMGARSNYMNVGAGNDVYVEFMAKSTAGNGKLVMYWYDCWDINNWGRFTNTTETVGAEWTKITFTKTMEHNYFALLPYLNGNNYGTVYIDDVKVYRIPQKPAARIGNMGYATLNEALAAVREGDTVTVCAGKHPCQGVVTAGIYKNVTIEGEDGAIVPGIEFQVDLENVTIKNLVFTGERFAIGANHNVNGLWIENCTFRVRNRAIHAWDLDGENERYTYANINVHNCAFNLRGELANGKMGSAIFFPEINGFSVTDCTFRRVLINGVQAGISVTGDVTITGNVFEQCGNINVNIPGLKDGYDGKLTIEGNTFVTPEFQEETGNWVRLGTTTSRQIGTNYGNRDLSKDVGFYYAGVEGQIYGTD